MVKCDSYSKKLWTIQLKYEPDRLSAKRLIDAYESIIPKQHYMMGSKARGEKQAQSYWQRRKGVSGGSNTSSHLRASV